MEREEGFGQGEEKVWRGMCWGLTGWRIYTLCVSFFPTHNICYCVNKTSRGREEHACKEMLNAQHKRLCLCHLLRYAAWFLFLVVPGVGRKPCNELLAGSTG